MCGHGGGKRCHADLAAALKVLLWLLPTGDMLYERQEHTEVGDLWYQECLPRRQGTLLFDRDSTIVHVDRFEFGPGERLLPVLLLHTDPLLTHQNRAEVHQAACVVSGD